MVNCQLPESETLMGGVVLELLPPQAASISVAKSRVAVDPPRTARTLRNRGAESRFVPPLTGRFVAAIFLLNVSIYVLSPRSRA